MGRGQTRGGGLSARRVPLPLSFFLPWAPRKHELLLLVAAARPNAVRPRGLRTQWAWRGTSAPPSRLCVSTRRAQLGFG